MSTRIYCDQCGTETSKREALRFSLSGYSANRTSMGQLNDIDIDICPDCAQRFNDQTIGTVHIRRDHRDKLSPYLRYLMALPRQKLVSAVSSMHSMPGCERV